jgi:hypothetical protein
VRAGVPVKIKYDKVETVEGDIVALCIEIPEDEISKVSAAECERFKRWIKGKYLTLEIDPSTGAVKDWPQGETMNCLFKPRDGGRYSVTLATGEKRFVDNDYVPKCLGWLDGGDDYLEMKVDATGKIEGFSEAFTPESVAECFFSIDKDD